MGFWGKFVTDFLVERGQKPRELSSCFDRREPSRCRQCDRRSKTRWDQKPI